MDNKYMLLILLLFIILIALFLIDLSRNLERAYKKGVREGLNRYSKTEKSILIEGDIMHLPKPVQKYLNYVGVIGKEKVRNVKMVADGEMCMDPKKGWVKIKSQQYNFYDNQPTRLFFIKTKMFGIPLLGLHSYTKENANMLIKAAGLFTVLDVNGKEMRMSDTTTLFNDMCCFAPATLIDKRIEWEVIDNLTVKATFEAYNCKISAVLYFNDRGELINFVSDDRYYIPIDGSCKKFRWSTPMGNYKERSGVKLATYGEAVWNFPQGDYCYAKFTDIKEVIYNNEI